MAIETNQIHNMVRTYQRTLGEAKPSAQPAGDTPRREDRVSVSAEARERHAHKTGEKADTHPEKSRKP